MASIKSRQTKTPMGRLTGAAPSLIMEREKKVRKK